jgi:hypothetical protein
VQILPQVLWKLQPAVPGPIRELRPELLLPPGLLWEPVEEAQLPESVRAEAANSLRCRLAPQLERPEPFRVRAASSLRCPFAVQVTLPELFRGLEASNRRCRLAVLPEPFLAPEAASNRRLQSEQPPEPLGLPPKPLERLRLQI